MRARIVTSILWIASGLALAFLVLPFAGLIIRAIETQSWQQLPDSGVLEAITLSLITTTQSALLTVALGLPLAYVIARRSFPLKRAINLMIELPIVLPPAVAGLALLVTYGRRGVLGSTLSLFNIALPFTRNAVIIAQTFVAAPFFIRAAILGFQNIPVEIEDAARVDGASELDVFRYITLPMARRTLAAGLILSWARALGEFGATILFAGSLRGETQTMPLFVYNILERNINAAILTGLILVGMAVIALLAAQSLSSSSPAD